ncbi:MAG: KUP/HAK/KT family potassium transporter [Puia sp.]
MKVCGLISGPNSGSVIQPNRKDNYISRLSTSFCLSVVGSITLYFRSSSHMEAAYGLAITLCMLATSILFANYLISRTRAIYVDLPVPLGLSDHRIQFSFCQPG